MPGCQLRTAVAEGSNHQDMIAFFNLRSVQSGTDLGHHPRSQPIPPACGLQTAQIVGQGIQRASGERIAGTDRINGLDGKGLGRIA